MIILGTNSIKDTGYDVANSCRFNSASSDRLNRTLGTPTNNLKWTYSFWIKRSKLGEEVAITEAINNSQNKGLILFRSDDQLEIIDLISDSYAMQKKTNRKFRDVSAWYHIVFSNDSTVGSPDLKIYVNGVEETSLATDNEYSQNQAGSFNSALANHIGASASSRFSNCYFSEFVFIDGQQLAADQFGEFDEDSGIWKPIDVSGLTFGNNGFYLDFEDSAALGDDVSGNGNDFTVNNLTAVDQSVDSCTNNWCVQNSIAKPISGSPTFSQGNLTIASGSGWKSTIGTFALTKGKWYWETKGGGSAGTILNGIASTAVIEAGGASNGVNNNATIGVNLPAYAYHGSSGAMYRSDTTGNGLDQGGGSWGTAYNTGDLISVYLDLDNYKLYTAKNNTLNVSGTGYSIASGYAYYPLCVPYTNTINLNYGIGAFGATAVSSGVADANGFGSFEYDPSRGGSSDFDSTAKDFLAICTKNLAEYG